MSQGEANKAVRVLRGERLKYTCRVHILGAEQIIEFQANYTPSVRWNDQDRCLWLGQRVSEYEFSDVMRWPEDAVLLVEENPK